MTAPTIDSALAAEHAAVGALLLTADSLRSRALSLALDDDFQDRLCRFTVRTVRSMVEQNVPVDPVSLHQHVVRHGLLRDADLRTAYSVWIADRITVSAVPTPAAVLWYVGAVVEQGSRHRIVEAAENIARVAEHGSITAVSTVIAAELTAIGTALARLRGAIANV